MDIYRISIEIPLSDDHDERADQIVAARGPRAKIAEMLLAAGIVGKMTTEVLAGPMETKPVLHGKRRSGSKSDRYVSEAVAFLQQMGRRSTAREIFTAIHPLFGGPLTQSTINAFASVLSHSSELDNVRNEGYGLPEWADTSSVAA